MANQPPGNYINAIFAISRYFFVKNVFTRVSNKITNISNEDCRLLKRSSINDIEHMAYAKLHKTFSHREVEDQEIGRVHHVLVEGDHADHEQVADEAGDDDDGEEDGHQDGHNLLKDLQVHGQRLLSGIEGEVVHVPGGVHHEEDTGVEGLFWLHPKSWPSQNWRS